MDNIWDDSTSPTAAAAASQPSTPAVPPPAAAGQQQEQHADPTTTDAGFGFGGGAAGGFGGFSGATGGFEGSSGAAATGGFGFEPVAVPPPRTAAVTEEEPTAAPVVIAAPAPAAAAASPAPASPAPTSPAPAAAAPAAAAATASDANAGSGAFFASPNSAASSSAAGTAGLMASPVGGTAKALTQDQLIAESVAAIKARGAATFAKERLAMQTRIAEADRTGAEGAQKMRAAAAAELEQFETKRVAAIKEATAKNRATQEKEQQPKKGTTWELVAGEVDLTKPQTKLTKSTDRMRKLMQSLATTSNVPIGTKA